MMMKVRTGILLFISLFLYHHLKADDSIPREKKNLITLECGLFKTTVYDEYINFKNYSGNKFLPWKVSYLHLGSKFTLMLNFYLTSLKMDTDYSEQYIDYDFLQYSGGELSYRLHYNLLKKGNFTFSAGTGILSTGSKRSYVVKYTDSSPEYRNSKDITSASFLAGFSARYRDKNSLVMLGFDVPIFNYFQNPSEINSIRLNNSYPNMKWYLGSVDQYFGFNVYGSAYQSVYKDLYVNASYTMNYYHLKTNYPIKSLKYLLTFGLSYSF